MFKKMMKALKPEKSEPLVLAPCAGQAVPLSEVSDPVFSGEILGKGIAIIPTVGEVHSPVNGTIETMFDTGHAVSLTADFGGEILVHVGLDTVALKGKHYTVHKKTGDTVKVGDLLIGFDIEGIKADGYDVITPIVVCNSDVYTVSPKTGDVAIGDELIRLTPNA